MAHVDELLGEGLVGSAIGLMRFKVFVLLVECVVKRRVPVVATTCNRGWNGCMVHGFCCCLLALRPS